MRRDPACCYGWAGAKLSAFFCCGGVPATFFATYQQMRPLDFDWEDRLPLLHLRDTSA